MNYKRKHKPYINQKTQILSSSKTKWLDDHSNLESSYISQEWLKSKEYLIKLGVTCFKNNWGSNEKWLKSQRILIDGINQEWLGSKRILD